MQITSLRRGFTKKKFVQMRWLFLCLDSFFEENLNLQLEIGNSVCGTCYFRNSFSAFFQNGNTSPNLPVQPGTLPQFLRRIQIWSLFGHIWPVTPAIMGFLKIATQLCAPNDVVQPGIRDILWSRFRIWSPFVHIWSGSHDIANILMLLK